jgi:uncharacterized membrane protein (UPF0127 family)
MIIKNISKNIVISKNGAVAASFFDRLLGLLNPHNFRFLVFQTHFGIHTLFMKNNIDVILLDDQNKVVKMKINLKPNSLFVYYPKYSTVIEMPKGTIKKSQITINDKISFE